MNVHLRFRVEEIRDACGQEEVDWGGSKLARPLFLGAKAPLEIASVSK